MKTNKVILLSTQAFCLSSHRLDYPATRTMPPLGLVVIKEALKHQGFKKARLFPSEPERALDLANDNKTIASELRKMGADEAGTIFGLSTFSDDYFKLPGLSDLLRREFPKAKIVAGGPHFNWEKIGDQPNTVEDALEKGLVDAVQVGHAQAFVDLVLQHQGNLELADGSGFYRWDPAARKVIGNGFGKFPDVTIAPYAYQEKTGHLRALWDDGCRNLCDYCVIPQSHPRVFSAESVVRSLKPVLKELQPQYFTLLDSNPFDPGRIDYYERIINDLFQGGNVPLKFSYLNPSFLTNDDYMAQLGQLFVRHSFWGFYIGRDSVTETNAAAIGKKVHGRLKDQSQLDSERAALVRFINALQTLHAEYPDLPPRSFTLYYVISPLESRESAQAIVNDMEDFVSLSDNGVKIGVNFFPLTPFPGTRLRKRLSDKIDLANFSFSSSGLSGGQPWKDEVGPGKKLLARLFEVNLQKISPRDNSYFNYFRKVIDETLG